MDLRILFLVLLFATLILYSRLFPSPGLAFLWDTLTRIFLVLLAVGTVIVFALILTRTDPFPYIRWIAYQVGLQQFVEFNEAIPVNLASNIKVGMVQRADTDGDNFNEWLVFYQFDKQSGPVEGIVYDNDRGNPPIIFPYALRAPDRNYLGQDSAALSVEVKEVAKDQNGPNNQNIPELVVNGGRELTIFRFKKNSESWESPQDNPPRYNPIGFFHGSGGVNLFLDDETKQYQVQVIDLNSYERSQLAVRSIYGLQYDPQTNAETFLDPTHPMGSTNMPQLAPPLMSTIDLFPSPPQDVFNTPYPEKVVLAFYASTCGSQDRTLCQSYNTGWKPPDFLVADSQVENNEALGNQGNPAYFGLTTLAGNQNILVSQLKYYPHIENETSQPTLTGPQPQFSSVEITFTVNGGGVQTIKYEMAFVKNQWKILRKLPASALESSLQPPMTP